MRSALGLLAERHFNGQDANAHSDVADVMSGVRQKYTLAEWTVNTVHGRQI